MNSEGGWDVLQPGSSMHGPEVVLAAALLTACYDEKATTDAAPSLAVHSPCHTARIRRASDVERMSYRTARPFPRQSDELHEIATGPESHGRLWESSSE
ncbi:MAG: hypothetical protein P8K08_12780 [Fuerstiella sp.]|jgi:hypothetical protein|nr:hypothetical protein [Fuerstiella sp.]